ncbi:Transcription factor iws1 [Linnemannia gamsii]|uniref:Transcription factor iws1 n=1 Tax=Linnemannia gamsii TaxID=64522 RepID=A0A9P6UFF2_9FUNG|nr:Transcription factor iws1 [Linnemannia gamsii]
MSSDKKRIVDDIFGDDDDEDDHQSQDGDRDYEDRPSTGDKEGDGAEGQDGADGDADAAGGEGADEEDDDDVQLPSFKKRNADGESPTPEQPKKKKKLAKKAKPTEGGAAGAVGPDGAELPLDPMQQKMSKLDRDFELAVKSGKSTSRRRKKDDEDIDTELDESAARFVAKMQEAAFADIDAKLNRQAALAKVRMLENVKAQLNKSHVHNTFLDNGILESMKLWLEPLQDASLPSLDIIQDFLDILDILPIQTHHLSTSGVGRVVYFYTKVDDSRVTPSIKRKAHALVDKWSRPIVKLSQDYRTKKINYAEGDRQSTTQRRRYDNAAAAAASAEPAQRTMGVRVPQTNHHAYALMPESSITYDKSRSGKSDKYKKLKSHMAKIKQVKRS